MTIKIVRLIDSNQHIFETKPYGYVDMRTSDSETEEEKQSATESLRSFNYSLDNENILRLVVILLNVTFSKAIEESEILFEETIDIIKWQPLAKIKYCDGAGYWVDMKTGKTTAFLKPKENKSDFLGSMFQMSLGYYSPMFNEQMILSLRNNNVIEAFIRSMYWYNNSNTQKRQNLQFLYKWIAIETMAKTYKDEDIIPKLCLVIGLPTNKYCKLIPINFAEKLNSINGLKHYKKIINKELFECKNIRNKIVHSGFKDTIVLNENIDLKLYLLDAIYNWMTYYIEKIVITGKKTLEEIWDVMYQYVIQEEKLINWLTKTLFTQVNTLITNDKDKLKNL